jgi:hypothetical protein
VKSIFAALALFGVLAIQTPAHAAPVQARILALSCGSLSGVSGATTVVLSGWFAGDTYVNITNVNPLGIPFTQQAKVLKVRFKPAKLTIELLGMLTGTEMSLVVDTTKAVDVMTPNSVLKHNPAGEAIEMSCASDFEKI